MNTNVQSNQQRRTKQCDCKRSIAVIGAPTILVNASRSANTLGFSIDQSVHLAAEAIRRSGCQATELTVANRHHFGLSLSLNHRNHTKPVLGRAQQGRPIRVPMTHLVDVSALESVLESTGKSSRPMPVEAVRSCDAVALVPTPGLTRTQMRSLLQSSPLGVIAITDDIVQYAGPGTWERVFRSASVVILSDSAAKAIASQEDSATALECLANWSKKTTLVMVSESCVSVQDNDGSLCFRIDQPAHDSIDITMFTAFFTIARIANHDSQTSTLAALGALEDASQSGDIQAWIKRAEAIQNKLRSVTLEPSKLRSRTVVGSAVVATVLAWVLAVLV